MNDPKPMPRRTPCANAGVYPQVPKQLPLTRYRSHLHPEVQGVRERHQLLLHALNVGAHSAHVAGREDGGQRNQAVLQRGLRCRRRGVVRGRRQGLIRGHALMCSSRHAPSPAPGVSLGAARCALRAADQV